ncbi:hypothetical protein GGR57DRAFT_466117 [Xylariaceae sp. FL1272]|nr:hypothetical protein GGR57DRAFT_466117 [Xylariaceae sp. FL1272]
MDNGIYHVGTGLALSVSRCLSIGNACMLMFVEAKFKSPQKLRQTRRAVRAHPAIVQRVLVSGLWVFKTIILLVLRTCHEGRSLHDGVLPYMATSQHHDTKIFERALASSTAPS